MSYVRRRSYLLIFCCLCIFLPVSCSEQARVGEESKEELGQSEVVKGEGDVGESLSPDAASSERDVDPAEQVVERSISVETQPEQAPTAIFPKTPGEDKTIQAFQGEYIHFTGQNRRKVDKKVVFPEAKYGYKEIFLQFALRCPKNKCDFWDRWGHLAVVLDAGTKAEKVLELSRFVTPYRIGASWRLDVTRLRPLLTGEVTLRIFIDTWVGPGHNNGEGWLVDASFTMKGGLSSNVPVGILPLWNVKDITYGNPAKPIEKSVPMQKVQIPAYVTKVLLRSFVTGHGQGNAQHCAEFCRKTHHFQVGSNRFERTIWRDNCAQTKAQPQYGTWKLSRAGWCPGAEVEPWLINVTSQLPSGQEHSISYGVEKYTNTCRPDSPNCSGCMGNWGDCKYNYNGHTRPYYIISAFLLLYR